MLLLPVPAKFNSDTFVGFIDNLLCEFLVI